jgi:hypothetical protein
VICAARYNDFMARGWESKSVEDQIGAAEAAREARAKPHLSPEQRELKEREQSLLLSRAQILGRLKTTTNQRYRDQLQIALDHLDAELKGMSGTDSGL